MKQEHKYAQVLRWIADGEEIDVRASGGDWRPLERKNDALNDRILRGGGSFEFRLKPRTITVNGREIVAGESEAPKLQSEYFLPHVSKGNRYAAEIWDASEFDLRVLNDGLVHLTKENAIAHAKAMLGID